MPYDVPAHRELYGAFRRAVIAKIERDLAAEALEVTKIRERTLPLVRQSVEEARAQGLCGDVWLFGSFAWGQPSERSDVDLLLAACRDPDSVAVVVGRCVRRDIHALRVEDAPDSLRERVFHDGVKL